MTKTKKQAYVSTITSAECDISIGQWMHPKTGVYPDFGRILEAKYPRKIVHNSHSIVDHLQHRQNVKLSEIFDTFVAYRLVSDDKTHRSLEETIQDTLNK
uniref:Uncharacterized protein n=1 Tax=Glossina palpalis gambiensis TaxID=67801 RepID=A0A1B0AKR9_9MUSC